MRKLISSESVTEGHPDKLADFISDSVLDAFLSEDPQARVAVETVLTNGLAFVTGETRSTARPDVQAIVREAVRQVGYTEAAYGFDAVHSGVMLALNRVDRAELNYGTAWAAIEENWFWLIAWIIVAAVGLGAQMTRLSEARLPARPWSKAPAVT